MHGSSNSPAANNLRNNFNRTERPLSIYDNLTSGTTTPSGSTSEKLNHSPAMPNGSPYIQVSVNFENKSNSLDREYSYNNKNQPKSRDYQSRDGNMNSKVTRNNSGKISRKLQDSMDESLDETYQGIELENMTNRKQLLNIQRSSNPITVTSNQFPTLSDDTDDQNVNHTKPVISDAKSKFFGLSNGQRSNLNDQIDHDRNSAGSESNDIKPVVEEQPSIVQPRYQNIPANSALFRKLNSPTSSAPPEVEEMQRDPINENCMSSDSESSGRIPHMDERLDHSNRSTKYDMNQPSQVVYMSTTVPQNIKGSNIAGRHTPTRNSLRHSRMLVVNNNYQVGGKPNPLRLTHPSSTRTVLILSLILAIIIVCIGIWISLWAPNTRTQDNPYWSGITLLCGSSLGLFTQQFRREKRQKYREKFFCALKVIVILLNIIATVFCAAAFIFAVIHYANLSSSKTNCSPANILIANDACICTFGQGPITDDEMANVNGTQPHRTSSTSSGYSFHYTDLSCNEVSGPWLYILIISMLLNALGFLFGACFLILLFWKRKKSLYSTVRTNPF